MEPPIVAFHLFNPERTEGHHRIPQSKTVRPVGLDPTTLRFGILRATNCARAPKAKRLHQGSNLGPIG